MENYRAKPLPKACFNRCVAACGALFFTFAPSPLRAGDQPGTAAPNETSASTDPIVKLQGQLAALGDKGVLFHFTYTGEEFAALSGGLGQGSEYEGLIKLELTLDLKKVAGWDGATFYASVLYPHGNGITNKYVGDYNVLSSIDAYDSIRLFELWLEQKFDDGRISVRIGNLTTDNNFLVSACSALFINSIYGDLGTTTHDINSPIYPLSSPGIRLRYDPTPSFYMQTMVVDDNPGTQDGDNKHGLRFNLTRSRGALGFAEAGYATDPQGESMGGSYKIGGFYDTGIFKDDSGAASSHGDYGVYAIVDQQLYRAPGSTKDSFQGLAAFARTSYAPDDRNPVFFYFDTGLNYNGLLPGRPKDVAGVAFSLEKLSDKLLLPSGQPVPSHRENVLEATYLANLNTWFSLQPDFQYIINPGGTGTTRNAIVAGIRFNITF